MNARPEAVMIYAAGFGTRMGALTKILPKPLIPVAGAPMIDHSLKLARALTPSRIVINLHYRADLLADHLMPQGVILSHEPEILETGGGLRNALPLLGKGPVFTMNPDVIWNGPNPLIMLREAWQPKRMDALLMCIPIARAMGYSGNGDFNGGADGRLQRGTELVYGGVQILKTEGLGDIAQKVFSLNVLWDQILADNRLYSAIYPGVLCDVGNQAGLELAETMLGGE